MSGGREWQAVANATYSYCVLVMGFYYAPPRQADTESGGVVVDVKMAAQVASDMSSSMYLQLTKMWAAPSQA